MGPTLEDLRDTRLSVKRGLTERSRIKIPMAYSGTPKYPEINDGCLVYRFYDATDRLLYVGQSAMYPTRWRWHLKFSPWIELAARGHIHFHDDVKGMDDGEKVAIATEQPLFNGNRNWTVESANRLIAYLTELDRLDLLPTWARPKTPWQERLRPALRRESGLCAGLGWPA